MASLLKPFIIFILSLLCVLTFARAKLTPMFVFGDSLADNGNNNNLNVPLLDNSNFPYNGMDFPGGVPTGRFSNGFNGVDYIAKFLGFPMGPPPYLSVKNISQMLQGVNFASAGSGIRDDTGPGTINMTTQIQYFQKVAQALNEKLGRNQTQSLIAKSLFTLITANNDMIEYYSETLASNETLNEQFISSLADKFTQHITALYKLGARKFYIAGNGHLGCIPFLTSQNTPTGTCIDALNKLSKEYNVVARDRVNKLKFRLPEMKYSYADIYRMNSDIIEYPLLFGITELKKACCGGGTLNGQMQCTANATYCHHRNNYYFWDWFHPTQTIYRITSELAFFGLQYSSPTNIQQLLGVEKPPQVLSKKTNIQLLVAT